MTAYWGWAPTKGISDAPGPKCSAAGLCAQLKDRCKDFVGRDPDVFKSELGYLKNYVPKIKLEEGGIPVTSRDRRVPLNVQEVVRNELDILCGARVIVLVEATEWLVPEDACKANSEIRLCESDGSQ